MLLRLLSLLFLLSFIQSKAAGQGFQGAIVGGINAAQIEGDKLAGYNKLGISGGLKLMYPVTNRGSISMEFLYSQRGSNSSLSFSNSPNSLWISLDYVELPMSFIFNDWYMKDGDYYKVSAEGGLSYGRLFKSSSSEATDVSNIENFNKNDISVLAGLSYKFNKNWGFSFRYTRSLRQLYYDSNTQLRALLSYFLTFRIEYHF